MTSPRPTRQAQACPTQTPSPGASLAGSSACCACKLQVTPPNPPPSPHPPTHAVLSHYIALHVCLHTHFPPPSSFLSPAPQSCQSTLLFMFAFTLTFPLSPPSSPSTPPCLHANASPLCIHFLPSVVMLPVQHLTTCRAVFHTFLHTSLHSFLPPFIPSFLLLSNVAMQCLGSALSCSTQIQLLSLA